jgi:hypothetical protein
VSRYPLLLLDAPDRLSELVNDLAMLLTIPESSASALVLQKPELIVQGLNLSDPRLWQSNLDTLASRLGLEMEKVRTLVTRNPTLLVADPQTLYHQCTELRGVLEEHDHWIRGFESAPLSVVRNLLRLDLERLRYLSDDPVRAATWTPSGNESIFDVKAFQEEHQGFKAWLNARRKKASRRSRLKAQRMDVDFS